MAGRENRSKLLIMGSILQGLIYGSVEGVGFTRLMYKSQLNYPQFKKYMAELERLSFVRRVTITPRRFVYQITDRGRTFYSQLERLMLMLSASSVGNRECDAIERLSKLLMEVGFKVAPYAKVTGKSGVSHNFDLVCEKQAEGTTIRLVIDIASPEIPNTLVDAAAVIRFFGKVYDTDPDSAHLICISGFSRDAVMLASRYGVTLLNAEDLNTFVEKVKVLLSPTISQRR